MIVHMDQVMGSSEVAVHLGIGERRVRAMIADGQLPGQRLVGRWVIPAEAVAAYRPKSVGRPMSEDSAWAVLNHLNAKGESELSSRLEARLRKLRSGDTAQQLRSWMAARGKPLRVWAFQPALAELRDDPRVVVSGDSAVSGLEPSGRLCVYVGVANVEALISDYRLRVVEDGSKLPNAVMWVVKNLESVPRAPQDKHNAAELVAAMDLLDDGDPRAVGAAHGILRSALEAWR